MSRLHRAIFLSFVAAFLGCDPKQDDCLAGSVACDGTCVRLTTDSAHCGACGNTCPGGEVCSNGACAATCAAPLATCGVDAAAFCTNLSNDPANCGGCGELCAGGLVCDQGACAVTCADAGSLVCDGRCVDPSSDVANCGACGHGCEPGTTCVAALCAPTCPVGQVRCGDRCVDLASDQESCGACGAACPDFGVCSGGECTAVSCLGAPGFPGVPDLVGPRTWTVAPLDVDRDGMLDLAVAPAPDPLAPQDGTVEVLRNLGGRRLEESTTYAAGLPIRMLRTADVDGDGLPDLVAAGGGSLSVLRGAASGGLLPATAPQDVGLFDGPYDLALGDLDADGHADAVSAAFGISVSFGTPSGNFGPRRDYSSDYPLYRPRCVAVGDLNGDGFLDVVGGDEWGSIFQVGVQLNDGAGGLGPVATYGSGALVAKVALADADGDGDLDLLGATDYPTNGLVVMLNTGGGAFGPPTLYPGGTLDYSLAVADLDGDGDPDAAIGDWGDERRVLVFRNAGDGTFLPPEPFYDQGAAEIAPADLDVDGRIDLSIASSAGQGTHLLWNAGGGSFLGARASPAPIRPSQLLLGDIDGDGRTDAVGFEFATGRASVLRGNGDGTFVPGPSFDATAIAAGDLDGDGDTDVVAEASSPTDQPLLRSYRSDAGALVLAQEMPALARMALADVDGDGTLDVVGVSDVPWEIDEVVWLRGRGDATFDDQASVGPLDAYGLHALAVGDVDGNGWNDVVAIGGADELLLWRNAGGGSFNLERIDLSDDGYDLALGDLDGDGNLDAAYLTTFNSRIGVLLGRGDGTFAPLPPLAYDDPTSVRIGAPAGRAANVILVGASVYSVGVVAIDPSGELVSVGRWAAVGGAALAVGDVDGDLRPDLVMAGPNVIGVRLAACLP